MIQPLELEDILGLSLTITGTLVESYVKEGYADPTMWRALDASADLARHFKARLEQDGITDGELYDGVCQLITDLQVTAIECGEVVNRIIEEHGLPVDKASWNEITDCDHDHSTDGTDGEQEN